MEFNFEWDVKKARTNQKKHGVAFEHAATVFQDPRALSIYDQEHSDEEDRWITLGLAATGQMLVVHHTFEETDKDTVRLRIFSCRKATKRENQQYVE